MRLKGIACVCVCVCAFVCVCVCKRKRECVRELMSEGRVVVALGQFPATLSEQNVSCIPNEMFYSFFFFLFLFLSFFTFLFCSATSLTQYQAKVSKRNEKDRKKLNVALSLSDEKCDKTEKLVIKVKICRGAPFMLMHLPSCHWKALQTCLASNLCPFIPISHQPTPM